ncbi:hypothetical protein NA56DRAFT_668815 [Hyaloscypha hepaticicola]|uniref:Uncharacterized protein n=1 Tax=Hyaloscypha hepaticicola TaxID=2082293 RepID=A0A2J6QF88_9HELO|nr:hypothetical protein NA56DRAFT_668815 [Hyaloscypha hepaticicola]
MFCSSLRNRPEWSTAPATLLSAGQPRWQEKTLETQDLAIPLPRRGQREQPEYFRMILLSSSDLQPQGTEMARIERLYHSNGGRHVGVIFLLNEKSPKGNGTIEFMNLQARLLPNFEMQILPLFRVDQLLPTLFGFQRELVNAREATVSAPKPKAVNALLPYCSTNPPIPEHLRNILSDVCPGISGLAHAATTEDGQQMLRHWLPETGEAEDIIGFWEQEFYLD